MFDTVRSNPLIAIGAALFAVIVVAALMLSGGVVANTGLGSPNQLALKRVMLSSGGVGYFEYEARVSGDGVLQLPVRLDQVDDVLKSIVVFDNQGGAGTIQLPSRAPLSDIFRGLPFGPSALDSGAELIAALKGADVIVSGPERLEGRILSVNAETQKGENDLEITRHRVAVMTTAGLRQFVLEDAENVNFSDPVLQAQIDSALKSVAEHREGQGRMLTIRSNGNKSRIVTVGYVAATPLWKSSYRITTAEAQAKAWLQGWAVLENVSGVDWNDVELTLATGNPVTFRQALYSTYYVDRPEVPVEILGRILPQPDDGAVTANERSGDEKTGNVRGAPKRAMAAMPAPPPPPPAPAAPMMDGVESFAGAEAATASPDFGTLTKGGIGAKAQEAATQVVFKLPDPVTVLNGQSLSVPIVNQQASAARVSLFQPSTDPRHPLATVKLVNDTGVSLPGGVVTLYERDKTGSASYVGDARMNAVPKGDTRLLAFAADQKIIIDSSQKFDRTVSKIRVANGMLNASSVDVEETTYTIKGALDDARNLIIEHPRRPGWTLTAPDPKTADMTDTTFRIPVSVKAGETAILKVSTEWTRDEQLGLINLSTEQFLVYAQNARLSEAQRATFSKLVELKRSVDQTDAQIQTETAARARVFEEQSRIRENIAAAPERSDLQNRYLRSMNQLEDQADQRKKALDGLERTKQDQMKLLADAIAAMSL